MTNRDKYQNLHKNLWLVEDREGLEQAAKIVAGQRGRDGLPVTIHSTRMQLSDKYPCIVVLIKVDVAAIEVISVITDTTLNHCIRAIGALPR